MKNLSKEWQEKVQNLMNCCYYCTEYRNCSLGGSAKKFAFQPIKTVVLNIRYDDAKISGRYANAV